MASETVFLPKRRAAVVASWAIHIQGQFPMGVDVVGEVSFVATCGTKAAPIAQCHWRGDGFVRAAQVFCQITFHEKLGGRAVVNVAPVQQNSVTETVQLFHVTNEVRSQRSVLEAVVALHGVLLRYFVGLSQPMRRLILFSVQQMQQQQQFRRES